MYDNTTHLASQMCNETSRQVKREKWKERNVHVGEEEEGDQHILTHSLLINDNPIRNSDN